MADVKINDVPYYGVDSVKLPLNHGKGNAVFVYSHDEIIYGFEDFTQLTYIQSDGNQYIDTGVSGGANAAYEIKFDPINVAAVWSHYFAGANGMTAPKLQQKDNSDVAASFPDINDFWWGLGLIDSGAKTVRYTEGAKVYLDGIEASFGRSTDEYVGRGWGDSGWWVFSSPAEPVFSSTMRLYYLKMYTNGVLVRDFVPVRREIDGVLGLWDKVESKFYQNSGSGTFIGA